MAENKNVVCRTCQKPILLGAACLNNAPTNHKALLLHFGYPTRHGGKEDVNVVCFGCEKPASSAGYKCPTSRCNLLLHQSCLELPTQVQQHSFHHPNHTLSLVKPQNKHCNARGKNCNAYPFYHCNECDFNLDLTCVTTHSQININTDDCQHTFISLSLSLSKHFQFTCKACGGEGNELASPCRKIFIHQVWKYFNIRR